MSTFYQQHIFFCNNKKDCDKKCCAEADAESMFRYAKQLLQKQDMHGEGKIRVSKAGCLGRCSVGPCIVVYPQGTWYTYQDCDDIETIVQAVVDGDGSVAEQLVLPTP